MESQSNSKIYFGDDGEVSVAPATKRFSESGRAEPTSNDSLTDRISPSRESQSNSKIYFGDDGAVSKQIAAPAAKKVAPTSNDSFTDRQVGRKRGAEETKETKKKGKKRGKKGYSKRKKWKDEMGIPVRYLECMVCGAEHKTEKCPDRYILPPACKNCGDESHSEKDCPHPKDPTNSYRYECLRCGERSHITRRCPYAVCRVCGKKGHAVKDCPLKWCHRCGQTGHYASRCTNTPCKVCGEIGHPAVWCPTSRRNSIAREEFNKLVHGAPLGKKELKRRRKYTGLTPNHPLGKKQPPGSLIPKLKGKRPTSEKK